MKFFQNMPLYALKMDNRRVTVYDLTPPVKWQIAAIWAIWWAVGVSEGSILLVSTIKRMAFNWFHNTICVFKVTLFVGKVTLYPYCNG